jgi:hypothetical protein
MDRQRYEETSRWAAQALELGTRLRHRGVITQATTTLARLEQRIGDPRASREPLEKVVSEARANGQVAEELRGLYTLGSLHFEAGDFTQAADHFATASRRAVETGRPWSPYGFDARLMGALTAYVQGRWDRALEIVDVTGQEPPGLSEAILGSAGLAVSAGRGDTSALALLDQLRPWWDRDGFLPISGAMAAIDLHGDAGDLERALAVHDEGVDAAAAIMESPYFLGRIRMSSPRASAATSDRRQVPGSAVWTLSCCGCTGSPTTSRRRSRHSSRRGSRRSRLSPTWATGSSRHVRRRVSLPCCEPSAGPRRPAS